MAAMGAAAFATLVWGIVLIVVCVFAYEVCALAQDYPPGRS